MRGFLGLAVGALLLLAGCAEDAEVVSEGEFLYFENIGMGQAGSAADTTEWVLRDSVSWASASALLKPLAPFKKVDFSQSNVVAIGLPKESGGYHIEVESIERAGGEVVVSYLLHVPANDCITLAAMALPFVAVKVRRFDDEVVRFARRQQRYECTWKQPS